MSQTKAAYVCVSQNKALFLLIAEASLKTEILLKGKRKFNGKRKGRCIIVQRIMWDISLICLITTREQLSRE